MQEKPSTYKGPSWKRSSNLTLLQNKSTLSVIFGPTHSKDCSSHENTKFRSENLIGPGSISHAIHNSLISRWQLETTRIGTGARCLRGNRGLCKGKPPYPLETNGDGANNGDHFSRDIRSGRIRDRHSLSENNKSSTLGARPHSVESVGCWLDQLSSPR